MLKETTTGVHQFGITKKKVIFKRKVSNISVFEYNFYTAISIKNHCECFLEGKKT